MLIPPPTERLIFREFQLDDLEPLFKLDSDPEVMKFLMDKPKTHDEVAASLPKIIARNEELAAQGFGSWVLTDEDEKFIGWGSLKQLPGTEEIEIGYRLLKSEWGKGYATEACENLMDYGFDERDLERIVAMTHPEHLKSKNVLTKSGFSYVDDRDYKPDAQGTIKVSYFEISVG